MGHSYAQRDINENVSAKPKRWRTQINEVLHICQGIDSVGWAWPYQGAGAVLKAGNKTEIREAWMQALNISLSGHELIYPTFVDIADVIRTA